MWELSNFYRQVESFLQDKNVSERIARTRHKHYEEKRKARIKFIEEEIKTGKLDEYKLNFPFFL